MCDMFNFFEFKVRTYSFFMKAHIEAYHTVERRVKSNNKTPLHGKIFIFGDNIWLIKWFSTILTNFVFFKKWR